MKRFFRFIKNNFALKRLWLLLFFPLGLGLTALAAAYPAFAEGYARTVYRVLSQGVNFLTSLLPFSLIEILLYLLIIGVLTYFAVGIARLIRNRENRGQRLFRFLITPLCALSVVYFAFVTGCGINYSRYTFAQVSGLPIQESSVEELYTLCLSLAEDVNRLRAQLPEDEQGVMVSGFSSQAEKAEQARVSYDTLEAQYPTLTAGYGAPKPMLASRLLSWCDITGIFVPFTFEANVNTDVPDYSQPATMCHELSHLRGYMREDEANFIAYLACRNSESIEFQYSGAMLAFVHTNNALYSADQELWQAAYATLSEGVRRDLDFNSAYWQQFEGPVSQISSAVNNAYLQANRQEDGVRSYGRVVDLLLADYRRTVSGSNSREN